MWLHLKFNSHDSKSAYKSDNNEVLIAMIAKVHTKMIYEKVPKSFFLSSLADANSFNTA